MMEKLSIMGHVDYREFLKLTYERLKEHRPQFSYRYFAKKAGLRSPAFFKMVIDGERNLTPKTTEKFILGLGLHGSEADYFQILVRYNQAKKDSERNRLFTQLRKYMERKKVNTLWPSKISIGR